MPITKKKKKKLTVLQLNILLKTKISTSKIIFSKYIHEQQQKNTSPIQNANNCVSGSYVSGWHTISSARARHTEPEQTAPSPLGTTVWGTGRGFSASCIY